MLIPNSVTEKEKQRVLSCLVYDLHEITQAWSRLASGRIEQKEYEAQLDDALKKAIYHAAREFVEHYELAPIEH